MGNLTVIGEIRAKTNDQDEVKKELAKLVEPTQKEKGCVKYDLHQDRRDPTLFFFLEEWNSEDDLDSHLQSQHVTACASVIGDLVERTEVYRLDRVS